MELGKSSLTVSNQADVNRFQGVKLLSAESLRKAIQIRDEIAKAKKRKELEKALAEKQSKESITTDIKPISKSPIQPFKIINGPQQNLCLKMSNCNLQGSGNVIYFKDKVIPDKEETDSPETINPNQKVNNVVDECSLKTPVSSKATRYSSKQNDMKSPVLFSNGTVVERGIDSIKSLRHNKRLEDRRLALDRSGFSPHSSFRDILPTGKTIIRPTYQESFKRANSILSNAMNSIEEMERSIRATETDESKLPAARCVNKVRAHLFELQAVLTRNERDFETLHQEKEMLSRQLQLTSARTTESSDASTFFTPASSRDYDPHCSTLKGIRPLSVSEMHSSRDSSEDDDTLLESYDKDNSISLKPMGTTLNYVNVDGCHVDGKLTAASSKTSGSEQNRRSTHIKTEVSDGSSVEDHPEGAIACWPEKGEPKERGGQSTEKQLSSTPKSQVTRLSDSGHSIHFSGAKKWDHRLNEEARVWYHDHVGSRIEKVILEMQQARDQLHQQTSDLKSIPRETVAFKAGVFERKSGEC